MEEKELTRSQARKILNKKGEYTHKELEELLNDMGLVDKTPSFLHLIYYLGTNLGVCIFFAVAYIMGSGDTYLLTRPIFVIAMVISTGWLFGTMLSFPFQPWVFVKINFLASLGLLITSCTIGQITQPNYQPYNPIDDPKIDCPKAKWVMDIKYLYEGDRFEQGKCTTYVGTYTKMKEYEKKVIDDILNHINNSDKRTIKIVSSEINLDYLPFDYCRKLNYDPSILSKSLSGR